MLLGLLAFQIRPMRCDGIGSQSGVFTLPGNCPDMPRRLAVRCPPFARTLEGACQNGDERRESGWRGFGDRAEILTDFRGAQGAVVDRDIVDTTGKYGLVGIGQTIAVVAADKKSR